MTTKEEFMKASELVSACRATIKCGCAYDEIDADSLYYQCRKFIELFHPIHEK